MSFSSGFQPLLRALPSYIGPLGDHVTPQSFYPSDFFFFNFILFNFTILYWFCHILKWICHRYTCVPHPEPSSLLPPHTIPLGLTSFHQSVSPVCWWLFLSPNPPKTSQRGPRSFPGWDAWAICTQMSHKPWRPASSPRPTLSVSRMCTAIHPIP